MAGWFKKLKDGLKKSSTKLTDSVTQVFTHKKLDDAILESLEEVLITADLGVNVASQVVDHLRRERFGKEISNEEILEFLADKIAEILDPVAQPLNIDTTKKPYVVLMVGVNGSGKTTTAAKMAKQWVDQGMKVSIAACDTFRAAAVEQLTVWGNRLGIPIIKKDIGADAAGLAFEAYEKARKNQDDVLLIDTAGRLQNNTDLMNELAKIMRVLRKHDASIPHACLLVLDATVGQNAHSQVETFSKMVDVTGLVLTKLDGTAKGGVVVSLADRFKLPIHAIGVGESTEDLQPFTAKDFAKSLVLEK
jgi:fused signal recognition particle receptor